MSHVPHVQPPQPQSSCQLPLPLETLPPATRLPRPTITITARQVWTSLTPSLQAQVRQTVVRVIQEIVRDDQP